MKRRLASCTEARRARSFEPLEPRLALDGSAAPIGADGYLTLSFAGDGSLVAGQPSELAATFGQLGTEQEWQDAILRAFQTWAVQTNADVGLVSDSGDPFGTPGATRDDERFGDIRIAGMAMSPEIGAISVPIDNVLSGTWHADVVFNTAFPYASLDDVFAIALHEAGNVFGLKDNNDPNSPMKAGPIPTATTPTSADIAALQALHGERAPDINELDNDNDPSLNDTPATATEWEPGGDDDSPGAIPAIAQGDIQSAGDIDYFALEVPHGYNGPITVTMRSDGISLLRPSLRLETTSGIVLDEAIGAGQRADRVSVTTAAVTGGQTLYVRASAAPSSGLFATGGYSLVAVFDGANAVSAERIEAASAAVVRGVEVDDLQQVFGPGEEAFRNDFGNNDAPGSATPLAAAAGFAAASRYETVASIGVVGDVDYYRVTPPSGGGANVAYVTLRSLDVGRLVPAIDVFDDQGVAIPTRVLVNGAGELLVEADTTGVVGDLLVRVAASDSAGPFKRGNYALSVGFVETAATLIDFASGALGTINAVAEHRLYAAEPQLFHFVLTVDSVVPANAAVVVEVMNATGTVVTSITSPAGESRSAGAAFLPIGEYTATFSVVALGDAVLAPLKYSLLGAPFSDPFVGDGSDPTTNPFDCGTNEGFYCYPGGIVSSDPYLWDDFVASLSESPTPGDTAAEIRRLLGDWWSWVWTQLGVNGPPLAQSDDYTTPPAAQSRAFALMVGPESVLANDIEPESDPVVAVLAAPPRHGDVTLNPDGTFAYTPNPGFVGFDWFRYTAYDFRTTSNSATVWVSASGSAGLVGDYSGDGVVDAGDGDFWRSNYGETGGPADGNGDGFVDAADYTIWRDGMSQAVAAQTQANAQAPPEPSAQLTQIDVAVATFVAPDVASRTRPVTRARFVGLRAELATSQRALLLAKDTAVAARDETLATWSNDERQLMNESVGEPSEPFASSLRFRRVTR